MPHTVTQPMPQFIPQSADTIARALQAQDEGRARARRVGLEIDGDHSLVIPDTVLLLDRMRSLEQSQCNEAVDDAVERFGLDAVRHSLTLVAAAKGGVDA